MQMSRLQQIMAHGFDGLVLAIVGGLLGGTVGYAVSGVEDPQLDEYFLHIPWVVSKAVGMVLGAGLGAAVGFPLGIVGNAILSSKTRPQNDVDTTRELGA